VEAADDEPIAVAVEDREGEALVAARVLERVEADDPDSAEGAPQVSLDDRRPGSQVVDFLDGRADALKVGPEDGLEARRVRAAGQGVESPAEAAQSERQPDVEQEQCQGGDGEPDDDRAEVVLDERLEIDCGCPPRERSDVRASLASAGGRPPIAGSDRPAAPGVDCRGHGQARPLLRQVEPPQPPVAACVRAVSGRDPAPSAGAGAAGPRR